MWTTRQEAKDNLEQQPFTLACRARHIIVPCYARNLLGETNPPILGNRFPPVIGWSYRLRSKGN